MQPQEDLSGVMLRGNQIVSSPAVAGGFVYIGSEDYNLYCLNATTGGLIWIFGTGNYVFHPQL